MSWIKAGRLWKIGVMAAGFLLLFGVFAYIVKQDMRKLCSAIFKCGNPEGLPA